jgi:hypothetical protein
MPAGRQPSPDQSLTDQSFVEMTVLNGVQYGVLLRTIGTLELKGIPFGRMIPLLLLAHLTIEVHVPAALVTRTAPNRSPSN